MMCITYVLVGLGYVLAGYGYQKDDSTNNILALGCALIGLGFIAMGIVNWITL